MPTMGSPTLPTATPTLVVSPQAATPRIAMPVGSGEWHAAEDEIGRTYYYNTDSGGSQWELPDAVPEQVPQSPQPVVIVLGIPIEEPTLAPIIRRVMILSAISALLIIADGIFSLVATGNVYHVIIGLLLLIIPVCGYLGARNKSRDYMCCFCGWSFACFLTTFVNVVIVIILICKGEYDGDPDRTHGYLGTSVTLSVVSSILYFLSFFNGNRLHQSPYFEAPDVTAQTIRVHTQPYSSTEGTHTQQLAGPCYPAPMVTGTICAPHPMGVPAGDHTRTTETMSEERIPSPEEPLGGDLINPVSNKQCKQTI